MADPSTEHDPPPAEERAGARPVLPDPPGAGLPVDLSADPADDPPGWADRHFVLLAVLGAFGQSRNTSTSVGRSGAKVTARSPTTTPSSGRASTVAR